MPEISINVDINIIDGWIMDGIEYALIELQIGHYKKELRLFTVSIE